ncbi:hypothetical protein HYS31_00405 [Candidatus Woesearchaeota archaeon]|nr:hypothetical protein [Candidatus Woesearchaeota archaeon]
MRLELKQLNGWQGKKNLIKSGIQLHSLKMHWKEISPANNVNNLKNKDLMILLSKNDEVVKYKYGMDFLKVLEKEKIRYKAEVDYLLGNYLFNVKQLAFSDKLMKFLK